ncbi:prolyl 4-hydroxylase subunit alpha-1-like isoform X3 [Portunus trituberculatus]|nr:prolyl 4-hydroxylase subunit alpha-1-like isoform X3 [Portunus trituberculatus]
METGQFYSSLAQMEFLFDFDEGVGELLLNFPEHLPAATRYLESYVGLRTDRDLGREIRGHPVHVFLVLKRLVLFWPRIASSLFIYTRLEGSCQDQNDGCEGWALSGNCLHYRDYMIEHCTKSCHACLSPELKEQVMWVMSKASIPMPSMQDLRGAALALSRLQSHYHIPVGDFMTGRIEKAQCTPRLTVEDCVLVADVTHAHGRYSTAYIWYDYCQTSASIDPRLQAEIKARKEKLEAEHDLKFIAGNINFFPEPLREKKNQVPWDSPFHQLCRGVYNQNEDKDQAGLMCYVDNRNSPYLTLQPVRYEQLHTDPEMYLFHDVVSDAEIAVLKQLAMRTLHRSVTLASGPKHTNVTEQRVSHTAWLRNSSHAVLERLAHRVAEVAQLEAHEELLATKEAEELQVLNYGIGGLYNAHHDVFYKNVPEYKWSEVNVYANEHQAGDRLATWMFYLSDVIAGGRTAFPDANVAVAPEKGAAVLWYNLKKNGNCNTKSLHGGCPVLLGQKWVANRWIRENANFRRRPCSTDPME